MKDYLWLIVVGVFALLAFIFFMLTISNSSGLISKLKKSKWHITVNIMVLLIGLGNIGIGIYLLQDIRKQIELLSSL